MLFQSCDEAYLLSKHPKLVNPVNPGSGRIITREFYITCFLIGSDFVSF